MKTARFASVVAQSGAPESYQLWMAPAKDKAFQSALKDHRVLTVHQENVGTKKDYGTVGYQEEPHAQYLLFPKSLRHFVARRIVGIDYRLLAKESRAGLGPKRAADRRHVAPERPAARGKPAAKRSARAELLPFSTRANATPAQDSPFESMQASHHGNPDTPDASPAKRPRGKRVLEGGTSNEIRRAMKELKAGKTVAAYERLGKLVGGRRR
jgi:hypothetical protein